MVTFPSYRLKELAVESGRRLGYIIFTTQKMTSLGYVIMTSLGYVIFTTQKMTDSGDGETSD